MINDPDIFLNVSEWLREHHGLRVMTGGVRNPNPSIDAVVLNGAYRRCAIHLRGPAGWHEPPDPALVADIAISSLHRHPAIELVAFRILTNSVRFVSIAGIARVERRTGDAGANEYRLIVERGDPRVVSQGAALRSFVAAVVVLTWLAFRGDHGQRHGLTGREKVSGASDPSRSFCSPAERESIPTADRAGPSHRSRI